jgi:hypothetical protein
MTYSLIAVFVFTALVVLGALLTIERALWRRRHGFRLPLLLYRDLALLVGLAWPFVLILGVRTLPDADRIALITSLEWTLVTTVPAILGVAVWVYFEAFVIRRPGPNGRREDDR